MTKNLMDRYIDWGELLEDAIAERHIAADGFRFSVSDRYDKLARWIVTRIRKELQEGAIAKAKCEAMVLKAKEIYSDYDNSQNVRFAAGLIKEYGDLIEIKAREEIWK